MSDWWILAVGGLGSGLLAGILGIGGGTVLVPILVSLGYSPVESVATSILAIVMTSVSGTIQNWRMGYVDFKRVIWLGLPSLITAQWGANLASTIPAYLLLGAFGVLLLANIWLMILRQRLMANHNGPQEHSINPTLARLGTGGMAGLLAGLFGVGGGVIMVPLQMLLLGEKIKVAIQTSLGVIVITSISACIGHAQRGNLLFWEGIILGTGGLLGAQFSTRYLPKLPNQVVNVSFRTMLVILAIYFFWRAGHSYQLMISPMEQ